MTGAPHRFISAPVSTTTGEREREKEGESRVETAKSCRSNRIKSNQTPAHWLVAASRSCNRVATHEVEKSLSLLHADTIGRALVKCSAKTHGNGERGALS